MIPTRCRPDWLSGLHTFVLRYCADPQGVGVVDRRILRLLLERVDLLAISCDGRTVLDRLVHLVVHLGMKENELVWTDLKRLFRLFIENLPEHKVREQDALGAIVWFHTDSCDGLS